MDLKVWNGWIFWTGFGAAVFATLAHAAYGDEWSWAWPGLTAYYMYRWNREKEKREE